MLTSGKRDVERFDNAQKCVSCNHFKTSQALNLNSSSDVVDSRLRMTGYQSISRVIDAPNLLVRIDSDHNVG